MTTTVAMQTCVACFQAKCDSEFPQRTPHRRRRRRCLVCRDIARRANAKAWYERDPRRARQQHRNRRFKIEFDVVWAAQSGNCAMCGTPMRIGGKEQDSVCVDHDRKCCSGTASCGTCVRGLIHRSCNLVLGFAKEDTSVLESLVVYLARWSAR